MRLSAETVRGGEGGGSGPGSGRGPGGGGGTGRGCGSGPGCGPGPGCGSGAWLRFRAGFRFRAGLPGRSGLGFGPRLGQRPRSGRLRSGRLRPGRLRPGRLRSGRLGSGRGRGRCGLCGGSGRRTESVRPGVGRGRRGGPELPGWAAGVQDQRQGRVRAGSAGAAWWPVFVSGVVVVVRQPVRTRGAVRIRGAIRVRGGVRTPGAIRVRGGVRTPGVVCVRGVIVVRRPVRVVSAVRLRARPARTVAGTVQGHAGREGIRQFRVRGGLVGTQAAPGPGRWLVAEQPRPRILAAGGGVILTRPGRRVAVQALISQGRSPQLSSVRRMTCR